MAVGRGVGFVTQCCSVHRVNDRSVAPSPFPLSRGRVRVNRVADVVADRIRELIVAGDLSDGDRLPRLDVLLDQFGVSAPSMREALRILESEGLITVQRGSVGGAVVHRPDARTAAYIVGLVLRSEGTELRDVNEGMALLEPVCALRCARRPDRATTVVPELRKINATARRRLDDDLAFNEAMTGFHAALATHCGNDTLRLVVGILDSIWVAEERAWAQTRSAYTSLLSRTDKLDRVAAHDRICDLIEAGDEAAVVRAVTEHLEAEYGTQEWIDSTERVDVRALRGQP